VGELLGPVQTSAVELVDADDVLDRAVYAITNPVKDHLVEKVHHWPGVDCFSAIARRAPLVASKPRRFFRQDNDSLPDEVALELASPPGLEHVEREVWVEQLRSRIAEVERRVAADRAAEGRRILGRRNVRRQRWDEAPRGREPRRGLNPRAASSHNCRRTDAVRRNLAFIDAYRRARASLIAGEPACFPEGTYWLVRYAAVPCAASVPPPS
jgi:hypothetical protein